MDEKKTFQTNHLLLAFIIVQGVIILFATIAIVSQLQKSDRVDQNDYSNQPSVTIEDLDKNFVKFPEDRKGMIAANLLDIMRNNTPEINLANARAEIRDGSIREKHFDSINVDYASAIVDIPDLEQSYQVFLQSSSDSKNRYIDPNGAIIFLCIKNPSDIVYSDFDCVDTYSQKTRNSLVTQFIKYYQFNGFIAWVENDETVVIVPNDFNVVDAERFVGDARTAVESMGISSDLFEYRIMRAEDYNYNTKG